MKLRTNQILIWSVIIASFIVSVIFYPKMPEQMASHWNAKGQVDGWTHKSIDMFLMPMIILFQVLLLYAILLIDPLRKNIRKFFVYYELFILMMTGFLFAMHLFMIAWNLGIQFSMNVFMPLMMGILFFVLGSIMPKLKPNWFMGIRTPWTLSNEVVWTKTHQLGGILFKAAAVIVLFGVIWYDLAIVFVLIPILAASLITVLYSLILYMKLRSV